MTRASWTFTIVVGITFALGFFAGYKTKELRIQWLKRKRDRLADKLVETQRLIEQHQKNY